jgi:hypothetical protein
MISRRLSFFDVHKHRALSSEVVLLQIIRFEKFIGILSHYTERRQVAVVCVGNILQIIDPVIPELSADNNWFSLKL